MKLETVKTYADLLAISVDETIKMLIEYSVNNNDNNKNELKNIISNLIETLKEVIKKWTNNYHHLKDKTPKG